MRHPMLTRAFSVTAATALASAALASTALASAALASTALAADAALAATGSAAASPAAASPAAARATKLSIAEAKSGIYRGQKDVISGRLTNLRNSKEGLADETVYLCRVQGRKLVKVSSKVTGTAGRVSFTVRPGTKTRYELVFPGVPHMLAPSHSRIVTVTVRHLKAGAA